LDPKDIEVQKKDLLEKTANVDGNLRFLEPKKMQKPIRLSLKPKGYTLLWSKLGMKVIKALMIRPRISSSKWRLNF